MKFQGKKFLKRREILKERKAVSLFLCISVLFVLLLAVFLNGQEASIYEWIALYHGDVGANNRVSDIAVDLSGNVYVTGSIRNEATLSDYATVAYDSAGNQLWVAQYNGPANWMDGASSIAVDSSGNVYVTGSIYDSGTSTDYATIAYDSSGNELWVARYNSPANYSDHARAIATDSSGNVYVTGTSYGAGTKSDYATIAYDSSGNQLWVTLYQGDAASSDIAVDLSGNVYVTGSSFCWATYNDYTTIAYDAAGNELWVAQYDGTRADPGHDRAEAMAMWKG